MEKITEIISRYALALENQVRALSIQKTPERISKIEQLIGESLPTEIRIFFETYDGEEGNGYGSFLGHSIVGLIEMENCLQFSKSLVKPDNPRVSNPVGSDRIIGRIAKRFIKEFPNKKRFGFFKPEWFKIEFEVSPNSFGGPYMYANKNTTDREREALRLTREMRTDLMNLAKELRDLEIDEYNWDNVQITLFGNGKKEVNRMFHDFDNTLPLSSTPSESIKKKYFHIKWIPIISDHCGNYIGIDLDPDMKGKKGQVIIFGRDEEKMLVLSDSWEEFLDWNLELLKSKSEIFTENRHLHDIYRELITNKI